jgi:murein DD-endopeptidase MepM/ murein hydrolase activator NlpD
MAAAALALAGCSSGADRLAGGPGANDPIYTASVPSSIQEQDLGTGVSTSPIRSAAVTRQPLPYASNANNYQANLGAQGYQQPAYRQPQTYAPQPQPQVAAINRASLRAENGEVQVEPGMTLYAIAQANNVSVRALAEANGLSAPYAVRTGQVLRMPGSQTLAAQSKRSTPAPGGAAAGSHQVAAGDTLYGIGRKYGVSAGAIASANGLSADATLSLGQTLKIPAGGTTRMAAAPAPGKNAATVQEAPAVAPDAAPASEAAPAVREKDQSQIAATEAGTDNAVATDPSLPGFRWPVRGKVISAYGAKPNGLRNEGINIAVPEGTSVRAADGGVVAYAGNELKGYGNLVLIRHEGGWVTAYAHNKELFVKRGDAVKRGDVIAKAGQTGSVSSPQVHFEIRKGATAMDPMRFLNSSTAAN